MDTAKIHFEIPLDILYALDQNKEEFEKQSRLYLAIHLFRDSKISSGQAAKLADMEKFQFWMELGKLRIPLIGYSPSELNDELERFNL